MTTRSRRSVLRAGTLALWTAVAGCGRRDRSAGTPTSPTTDTPTDAGAGFDVTTPGPGECSDVGLPRPTPTAEGVAPRAYPAIPAPLTESSAAEFAVAFEEAYQVNRFLAEDFIPGTDEVTVRAGVPDGAVRAGHDGYAVGLNGELLTGDTERATAEGTDTPTRAPSLTSPFGAWYFVSSRAALRDEHDGDLTGGEPPAFDRPVVVACSGE